ncbi:flagellar basal body rod C-terminal domain-containing protein [Nitrospira sp. M1]
MSVGLTYSLSGLAASQAKLNAAANNIANANTAEFKKSRVIAEEASSGGVIVTLDQVDTPGPLALRESEEGLIEQELSNVDLAEELVNVLISRQSFEANLSAIATQEQTLGSLLDILE